MTTRVLQHGTTWYRPLTLAPFPSRLKASGQRFVDANNQPVALLKGFNAQVVATAYSNATFAAMAAKVGATPASPGLVRMCVFWDQIQPTAPASSTDYSTIDPGYVARLDTQVANAIANNMYVYMDLHLLSNHFPSWASTVTTSPAHALVNYVANGQSITEYLAKRYGDPADPLAAGQYSVAVIGWGINEPVPPASDFSTAAIQANIVAGQATGAQWVRNWAPNWMVGITCCYGASAPYPNAPGSGQASQTFTAVSATPLAGVTQAGNFFFDVHDEVMGTILTGTPDYDARLSDGRPAATANAIKLGDAGYDRYPPLLSGTPIDRSILRRMQAAFWAPAKAYCAPGYANCPLIAGEHGWNATVDSGGGQATYLADKLPLWESLGLVARMEWDYATVQSTDGWAARPGPGAAGADPNGWQTWTNLAF